MSNVLSVIESGSTNSERDGTLGNPFIDLRDALTRADELAASHSNAAITIYFTRGSHFLLLEPSSARYSPQGLFYDYNRVYTLSLLPLPCSLTSGI